MQYKPSIILLSSVLLACGAPDSDGSGGGDSSSTATGTGSSTSSGATGTCSQQQTQADCEALGCKYVKGRLFSPGSDCTDMTEAFGCVQDNGPGVFNEWYLLSKDLPDGRLVLEYTYSLTPPVEGYQQCGYCNDDAPCDWCQCAQ